MFPSNTKFKSFNSDPINVEGQVICAVKFVSNYVPVKWHVAECEPIFAGSFAKSSGIITFNHEPDIMAPIKMIDTDLNREIQSCLAKYDHNFQVIGKLKNHQTKLHVNQSRYPIAKLVSSTKAEKVIQTL